MPYYKFFAEPHPRLSEVFLRWILVNKLSTKEYLKTFGAVEVQFDLHLGNKVLF